MLIDIDSFDVFLLIAVFLSAFCAFYFVGKRRKNEQIEELRAQSALILTRINDVDCAVADLKREVGEIECSCLEKKD